MITEAEKVRLDRIHALLAEQFKDYAIFVRPEAGDGTAWRVSNHAWGESVARQYSEGVRMSQQMQTIHQFHDGRGS